jgi:hypothetical protein
MIIRVELKISPSHRSRHLGLFNREADCARYIDYIRFNPVKNMTTWPGQGLAAFVL